MSQLKDELIITKIEVQKRNNKRVSIYINNEFAFGLSMEISQKFNLEEGSSLKSDFIEEVLKEEEQNKANNYAINLLSYRARSKKEIEDRLKGKGYEDIIIEKTIEFLKAYKLLNDKSFAKDYIRYKS